MSKNTKLLCLLLKAQKIEKSSEQGYAMVVVSILSIIMFSLLAASLIFSNIAKSRTDAFVDSQSSFAVAESGLNKRAADIQAKLETYSGVTGITDLTKKIDSCFSVVIPAGKKESTPSGTDDFECRNYRFDSSNNISKVIAPGGGISLDSKEKDPNPYIAYTFVSDRTRYVGASPDSTAIPTGQPFAGLNAAEYRYVIQSSGRKPINSVAEKSSNNTDLSMAFTTRVVPLFQFAIFYNGDLEFNSTSKMRVQGWVHSNANIYVQPAGIKNEEDQSTTDFLSKVSAAGSIYNRIDAWDKGLEDGVRTGITRVLLTGADCDTGTCQNFPYSYPSYNDAVKIPLTPAQINAFPDQKVQDGAAGTVELKVPSPGFTRKRNYFDDKVGLYYARADMRLEMVPDRDVTSKTPTPAVAATGTTPAKPANPGWTRDKAIIPFNFTSVVTGAANCTTALTAGSDPAANYIDPSREKFGTRQCNKFTKGQLQSLRQPVLVLTKLKNPTLESSEQMILEKPTGVDNPTAAKLLADPGKFLPITSLDDPTKYKILRALQVALVSTPSPVAFENLKNNFDNPVYGESINTDGDDTITCNLLTGCDPNLNSFKTEFKRLIKKMFPVVDPTSTNPSEIAKIRIRATLFRDITPNQIAALQDAWFLPAPIQRVETTNTATAINPRSSGFYDGREKRWITMLQTNIASLSVWNRDGLYVNSDDEVPTSAYAASLTNRNLAFNNGDGANFTNGLAFDRSPIDTSKTLTSTPPANLQSLGLGSTDRTEGGLVFHASVSDDLDGNGSNDVTIDKTDLNNRILKKKPDNTNYIDPKTGQVVIIDYHRKYPGQVTAVPYTPESPFAFAFNGGNYLPSALTLSSDQSVYVQGNFNNNANNTSAFMPDSGVNVQSPDSLPASVVADTITVLSNECVSPIGTPAVSLYGVPASQLRCGVKSTRINFADLTEIIFNPDAVKKPMAINAAFLSNTDISIGNYHTVGETLRPLAERQYSGGVNNYIRLLEDWANTYALNYSGSLVSLGTPLEYSGDYISGGGDSSIRTTSAFYNIPFRNFNYDPKFNKNENVPPLTPKASYVQQNGFNRTY